MTAPQITPVPTVNEDDSRELEYINDEDKAKTLGARPAEGQGSARVQPSRYQHGFFDPKIKHLRKIYFTILGSTLCLIIILQWLALPVYWGSLGETHKHVPNLNGWLVNRDPNGAFGQAMVSAFEANARGEGGVGNNHLAWRVIDGSQQYTTDEEVIHAVTEDEAWAIVVVAQNVTSRLQTARSTGDSSWNPQSAVTFYYNQGRNEMATNSYVVPTTQALLQSSIAKFSASFTAQYFASLAASSNSSTTLATLASAPQTISAPFSFTPVNTRPFSTPVATALLLVGQIYIIIFGFVTTMAHDAARGVIQPFLKTSSYLRLRIIVPVIAYIPLSFSYAMISLPFKAPFDAKYSYAGGFFIFWIFVYLGMCSLGLATEAMITFLTPRFISYFLLLLIIFNVSVASVPIDLQPGFYRYGYGFPVHNLGEAVRTIIFNTKNELGKNAGIIIAWVILSMVTTTLFTLVIRRKERNEWLASQKSAEKGDI